MRVAFSIVRKCVHAPISNLLRTYIYIRYVVHQSQTRMQYGVDMQKLSEG